MPSKSCASKFWFAKIGLVLLFVLFFSKDIDMKFIVPMLAMCCFALAGCQSTGSSCCGKCGGDAAHTHAQGEKCCGKCGGKKACPADCTKPCCAKK